MNKKKIAAQIFCNPTLKQIKLRRMHKHGPVLRIVNFHRVLATRPRPDDYRNAANQPTIAQFESLMAFFADNYNLIDLEEYFIKGASILSAEQVNVGITFDDGYKDILDNAVPICAKYKIPITIFCTTHSLDSIPLWFQRIYTGIDNWKAAYLEVPWLGQKIDMENRWIAMETIANSLKEYSYQDAESKISTLFPNQSSSAKEEMMDWEDLRRLSEFSNVRIGAHSRVHWNLTRFNDDELNRELTEPLARIREFLKIDNVMIAYPNGKYNEKVLRQTEKAGYLGGFIMNRGINSPDTDKFSMYREYVESDPLLCDFQLHNFDIMFNKLLGREIP